MRQFFGMSQRGDLSEAVRGLKNPEFLMLLSNSDQFEAHVAELEKLYPGVPSIGCIGMSYSTRMVEHGVSVTAFQNGVKAAANVLLNASTMPVQYIDRVRRAMSEVEASRSNTVCIDFCSGNDASVVTTLNTALKSRGIPLVGGTGDGGKVSCSGTVYEDAVAFALVRNLGGKVKTYKENIYHSYGNYRFIASNTDRNNYILGSLNGQPAAQVYKDILHVSDKGILSRTYQNPLGKLNGDDTCIVSIKDVQGSALACYRQVNDSDVLELLELGDYESIVGDTIQQIASDFPHRSAVFSINCLFRYNLFKNQKYMDRYLRQMSALGSHSGLIGYGEHYNDRFVNQSMTCVVFE